MPLSRNLAAALALLLSVSAALPNAGTQGPATPGAESHARRMGRAEPWSASPVMPFPTSLEGRAESLEKRRQGRAYAGAPPTLPHSSDFGKPHKQCLDCHEHGMQMGRRIARPMSHARLEQCLQCHVERLNERLPMDPSARDLPVNHFVGRPAPSSLPRFAPGAPPVVPHTLSMRGRCLSCHGEFGYAGMRTSHPGRSQCLSCHAAREAGGR